MNYTPKKPMQSAADDDELFGPGWLTKHLDDVMDALASTPEQYWPRLTGDRAEAQPAINAELRRRRSLGVSADREAPVLPPTIGPLADEYLRQRRHPIHSALDSYGLPARPSEPDDLWLRWKLRRACRKAGGHWWHSLDGMTEWFCCSCGKVTDGWPRDGVRRGLRLSTSLGTIETIEGRRRSSSALPRTRTEPPPRDEAVAAKGDGTIFLMCFGPLAAYVLWGLIALVIKVAS